MNDEALAEARRIANESYAKDPHSPQAIASQLVMQSARRGADGLIYVDKLAWFALLVANLNAHEKRQEENAGPDHPSER